MDQDLALQNAHKKHKRTSKVGTTMNIVYTNAYNKVDELQYPRINTIVHTTHNIVHTNNVHELHESHFCSVCTTTMKHNNPWLKLQSPEPNL